MTGNSALDVSALEAILDRNHDPRPGAETADRRAAVAAVLRPAHTGGHHGPELLFIQRATVASDPWSGQMAFPGGRVEEHDADLNATAERETSEEVGLDLSSAARLGSLSNVDGGRATGRHITVSGHCYWLEGDRPKLSPNREVADALWVPIAQLLDRNRYIQYPYPRGSAKTFPGIQLDQPQQVVWGLTLRFLADLFHRLDEPFIIKPGHDW